MAERSKGKTVALWVLTGLLAPLFLMAGGSKLAGTEQHVSSFARWGYADGFRVLVGAVELASAVLLVIPPAAFFGASVLALVMAGATYTHLFRASGEGRMAALTLSLLVLCALAAWARRSEAHVTRTERRA